MFGWKRKDTSRKPSWEETEALVKEIGKKERVQASARQGFHRIAEGVRLDGIEPNADLMQRLARVATDGYVEEHARHLDMSKEAIQEVFETEYREALESRTFFNPFTNEIEKW